MSSYPSVEEEYWRGTERTVLFALWHPAGEYSLIQSWPNEERREDGRQRQRKLFQGAGELDAAWEQRRADLRAAGFELTRSSPGL